MTASIATLCYYSLNSNTLLLQPLCQHFVITASIATLCYYSLNSNTLLLQPSKATLCYDSPPKQWHATTALRSNILLLWPSKATFCYFNLILQPSKATFLGAIYSFSQKSPSRLSFKMTDVIQLLWSQRRDASTSSGTPNTKMPTNQKRCS